METNAWKEAELRKSLAVKTARPVPHVRRSRSSQQTSLTNSWDMPVFSSASLANSVKHGPLTPGAKIGLYAQVERNRLRVEVSDGSAHAAQPRPADQKGGYGLLLVESLSSRWDTSRDGDRNVTWFELDRPLSGSKSRAPRSAGWGRAASLNSVTRRI